MLRVVFFCLLAFRLSAAPPAPETVAVIYNRDVPESEKLARAYAEARDIPEAQLVGLSLPDKEEVSRAEFDSLIRQPLVDTFDERQWWARRPDAKGNLQLALTRIQILVCMRGVPSRIAAPKLPAPTGPDGKPDPEAAQQQMVQTTAASVDSELTLMGVEGLKLESAINNPYFQKDVPIAEAGLPILLVGRIDAHSFAVCHRMIEDAITAENSGLWGNAVIDVANKFPQGDLWMTKASAFLETKGIPTFVDSFDSTLPPGFPLRDVAFYLGWYDWHVSGPFKAPDFSFRPGAVAIHLHSFSAAQLRNPNQNWSAALLNKGAAATIGNVYEPFLHLTHHLDVLTERLLAGFTLVEAAYMAAPALSWQNLVLGDPLYRPFAHLDGSGDRLEADATFRALRLARLRWGSNPVELEAQLRAAAERTGDARFLEALGLSLAMQRSMPLAAAAFRDAKRLYPDASDQIRMDLHSVVLDRAAKRDAAAIRTLQTLKLRHPLEPAAQAVSAWLNILDPPPPPPTPPPAR